jgi:hypothetical protein
MNYLYSLNTNDMNANKNLIENTCKTLRTKDAMYATSTKKVAGNMWNIMWVFGSSNYVSVTKMTNNPAYRFGGKIYKSFEDAAKNYKSPEMKTALMMAEIELKEYIAIEEIKRVSVLN